MLRSLNRGLSRANRWGAPNVVKLNSACASRQQTTNLGVGRSNRSGRATSLRSPCFLGIIREFNSFVLPYWYQTVGSMVRVGMGLIKNEHGVYHVRRKVPKGLEEATATVMGVSKPRRLKARSSLSLVKIAPHHRHRAVACGPPTMLG